MEIGRDKQGLTAERSGSDVYARRALTVAVVLLLIAGSIAVSDRPDRDSGETAKGATTASVTSINGVPGQEGADAGAGVPGSAAGPEGGGAAGSGGGAGGGAGVGSGRPAAGARGGGAGSCGFDGCEKAQGITDTTIKLGFYVLEGGDQAFAAFGVSSNLGNERRQAQILVDDLNRRGGIAGRKIVAHIVGQSAQSADPPGDQRRACVQFAEDAKVFAVIPDGQLAGPEFRQCLADRNTLSLSPAGRVTGEAEIAQQAPWGQLPNAKAVERVQRNLVPALVAQGYFGKWAADGGPPRDARVGLLVYDQPAYIRAADRVLKPLLNQAGVKIGDEFRLASADRSQIQSQMSQAVLRFKGKGVTHVMFLPGIDAFYFYQTAESQQFRPRYGVESYTFPQTMATYAPLQARGAMGIGWDPILDQQTPKNYPYSAQEKRCFALMQKGGEDANNRGSRALNFCDMVWLFEAAATRASRELTAGSFVGGLRAMRSWDFVGFATDFTRGTADGNYTHRWTSFDEACLCFPYRGGARSDV